MAIFYIEKSVFEKQEKPLCVHGDMRAVAFCYPSGVCAVRIENRRGHFVVLPYQGHQIWEAVFDGEELGMKTGIREPLPTQNFLESYGCFMMHAGLCAVGNPGPEDNHKTHGDLPVAPFSEASIEVGEDEKGKFMALSGVYRHYETFGANYRFLSTYKLYENGTLIELDVNIENLRKKPLEYAYLCHINFRPWDGAKICASAPADAKHILVHKIVPPTMPEAEAKALRAYMDAVQKNPEVHLTVCPETQIYNPEIVSTISYLGDENGYAHTMEKRADGYAFYVTHPVEPFNNSLRWIARTGDEDAMGMVLPATAEHFGYTHAKQKGQMRTLDAGKTLSFSIRFGLLTPVESEGVHKKIQKILG